MNPSQPLQPSPLPALLIVYYYRDVIPAPRLQSRKICISDSCPIQPNMILSTVFFLITIDQTEFHLVHIIKRKTVTTIIFLLYFESNQKLISLIVKKLHRPSERLRSLGIMGTQLRRLLKRFGIILPRGFRGCGLDWLLNSFRETIFVESFPTGHTRLFIIMHDIYIYIPEHALCYIRL